MAQGPINPTIVSDYFFYDAVLTKCVHAENQNIKTKSYLNQMADHQKYSNWPSSVETFRNNKNQKNKTLKNVTGMGMADPHLGHRSEGSPGSSLRR
jgi:hypothetical protein